MVEAASFDRGCGGCRLDIFVVVVGEEKERERERVVFYYIVHIILLGCM